jgi:hypothetical protein
VCRTHVITICLHRCGLLSDRALVYSGLQRFSRRSAPPSPPSPSSPPSAPGSEASAPAELPSPDLKHNGDIINDNFNISKEFDLAGTDGIIGAMVLGAAKKTKVAGVLGSFAVLLLCVAFHLGPIILTGTWIYRALSQARSSSGH